MDKLAFQDTWIELDRATEPLTSKVTVSELALAALRDFDYQTNGETTFLPFQLPDLPTTFKIGVIVGASGSGKSTLLQEFGEQQQHIWDGRALIDYFDDPDIAKSILFAVGLTSIPTWMKPYGVLSNGEKFRMNLARNLANNAVFDEYTSVVDRNIAKAASKSFSRFIRESDLQNIVIATCHRDILAYLQPDWIIDTDSGMYALNPRECLRQESMVAQVFEVKSGIWKFFSKHHYLTNDLSPFARCWIAVIDDNPTAFYSAISYPSGTVRNAFRGHRLVTNPDYQGFGIGTRFADFIAEAYVLAGKRFFAKTAHPRLGEYRERSLAWKPTSKNKRFRTDTASDQARQERRQRFVSWTMNPKRFTYSHEYIGNPAIHSTE